MITYHDLLKTHDFLLDKKYVLEDGIYSYRPSFGIGRPARVYYRHSIFNCVSIVFDLEPSAEFYEKSRVEIDWTIFDDLNQFNDFIKALESASELACKINNFEPTLGKTLGGDEDEQ